MAEASPWSVVSVACLLIVAVVLEGCGGGGGGGGTTTTTTTTTTWRPRTPPLSPDDAAKFLNQQYLGFDKDDDTSPLGVIMSMAAQPDSFYKNIYCSGFQGNPDGQTGCWKGGADCRMSASLYNHKMIVSKDTGRIVAGMSRTTGYVFNLSMVDNTLGKCSYIFDGASGNSYNRGCARGAPGNSCTDGKSAFFDVCPSSGKVCTADDPEVKNNFCQEFGGQIPIPPTHDGYPQCIFPGASVNFHDQASQDYLRKSHLRDMANARVERNQGSDKEGANSEKWNEVVIDEMLMMPAIWEDPAVVIPAFVYVRSGMPQSRQAAEQMRDEFCKVNHVDKIPVIAIDDMGGDVPFVALNDGDIEIAI